MINTQPIEAARIGEDNIVMNVELVTEDVLEQQDDLERLPEGVPVGIGWVFQDGVFTEPDAGNESPSLTPDQIKELRQQAYSSVSDPVYFKWQRGEATEQDWLDSVEAIRAAYPYSESD